MTLNELLISYGGNASAEKKIGLSEERIDAIIPTARQYIAFWRWYPDLFVDFLQTGGDSSREKKLKFYFYQRIFTRCCMRYRYAYMTFPRAYSKSFLCTLVLCLRCILYPNAKLFVTSGGKEQSAQIIKEKVNELCTLIPALKKEIDWGRGKTVEGKDYCRYMFKSGSWFDNVAAREGSRGKRRHGGVIEECVGVDGKILSEVIIPIMNVSRLCADGTTHQEEVLNKSQIYITTAGYKGTFPYEKLITLFVRMIIDPDKSIVMGGTWRIPVLVGLLDKNFISDLKQDGTFDDTSFNREYESRWSGGTEDAFFSNEMFDRCRKLKQAETIYNSRNSEHAYYVLGVDVGRRKCQTVVCVVKVNPQDNGPAIKSLVNIYTMEDEHFEDQAIKIKQLYYDFKARIIVIDGNGLGAGLMDYMVKTQVDELGTMLPDFGVENDDKGEWRKFRTDHTEYNAIYEMKANAVINTEAHSNIQAQLRAGKIKFLVDERQAKNSLLSTKVGKQMSPEERSEYLKPYQLTSILKAEMMNLREEREGINIILKQSNKAITKDKFSSLEYALYYIKQEEDGKQRRRNRRFSQYMFLSR